MARRPPKPSRSQASGERATGIVIRLRARHAFVRVESVVHRCTLRKSLFRETKLLTRPIAVGDVVEITVFGPKDAVVEKAHPRRSVLARFNESSRRHQILVANVDQVAITVSASNPAFHPRLIDRILVAAEREDLGALIIINKIDLLDDPDLLQADVDVYRRLGYPVILSSVVQDQGLDELKEILKDRTTAFSGHSGVGKSSLLNAIQPGLKLRTAEVSEKRGRGRHTTTGASLLPLDFGGFVVDTAGIRAFATQGLEPYQIALCFRDLAQFAHLCRFPTCTHDHEPECAVKEAVRKGEIDVGRYESYLVLIDGEGDLGEEEPA